MNLLMPRPQVLDPRLVEEGHTIPVARAAATHAGKRRAGPAGSGAGAPELSRRGPGQLSPR